MASLKGGSMFYSRFVCKAAVMIMLLLATVLCAQETHFSSIQYSGTLDISPVLSAKFICSNSSGRIYFMEETSGLGTYFDLNYFDLDNVIHSTIVGDESVRHLASGYAFWGQGISLPNAVQNQFTWLTYVDSEDPPLASNYLTLPHTGARVVAISQLDEQHALVAFKYTNYNDVVHFAYLNADAEVSWSVTLNESGEGLFDGVNALSLGDVALVNDSTFVITASANANGTVHHVMKYNSHGQRISDNVVSAANYYTISLNQTRVPETVLLATYYNGYFTVSKVSMENSLPSILHFPSSTPNDKTRVLADSASVVVCSNFPGAHFLELMRYDWQGNLLSSNTFMQDGNMYSRSYFDFTPQGNFACAHFYYSGSPDESSYYKVARLLQSDFTVDSSDECNLPIPPMVSVYPNPFHSQVSLGFSLSKHQNAKISIYNLRGGIVRKYTVSAKDGSNTIVWDGKDEADKPTAAGIYICKIETPELSKVVKLAKFAP